MSETYPTELKLWCVLCTPVNTKDDALVQKKLRILLEGPGTPGVNEGEMNPRAVMWAALAMDGIGDHRAPHYVTQNRRLLIFRTKRAAEKYARREASKTDSWSFKAQPVRLAEPDESDWREYEREINQASTWRLEPFTDGYASIIGKVVTPSEGADSARDEVVGVAATKPLNEAKRIVDAHNAEVSHLIAETTLRSWFA